MDESLFEEPLADFSEPPDELSEPDEPFDELSDDPFADSLPGGTVLDPLRLSVR